MPPLPALFTIPIATTKGQLVCTQAGPKVYLLSFNSPPDNRLVPDFNAALILALDIVEHKLERGTVVTTSSITKFYSNGLDYEAAIGTKGFMEGSFYPVLRRLLTYPMPTVALLPGHAFAAALMLAMAHDYRVMSPSRGYLCLNEVEFDAPLKPAMAGIFRTKLAPPVYRTLALEAKRYKAPEALADGIIDVLGGWDECEKLIADKKLVEKGKSGVYGVIKEEFYRDQLRLLDLGDEAENRDIEERFGKTRRLVEEGKEKVAAWEQKGGKLAGGGVSKLNALL